MVTLASSKDFARVDAILFFVNAIINIGQNWSFGELDTLDVGCFI